MGFILPTTLALAAAAALINIWMVVRIGQLRTRLKVSVGDGGHEALARRMRAQLNFAENTPIVLILVAAIELTAKGGLWLPWVAAIYALSRVAHTLGMDGGRFEWGRMVGIVVTLLVQLGLAGFATGVALGVL